MEPILHASYKDYRVKPILVRQLVVVAFNFQWSCDLRINIVLNMLCIDSDKFYYTYVMEFAVCKFWRLSSLVCI
jgi:hypothetical protein